MPTWNYMYSALHKYGRPWRASLILQEQTNFCWCTTLVGHAVFYTLFVNWINTFVENIIFAISLTNSKAYQRLYSMSELALVDHEEIVNRAFRILAISTRILWSKLHTEMAESVTNAMQLHSVMHPKLCPPGITCIPVLHKYAWLWWASLILQKQTNFCWCPTLVSHAVFHHYIFILNKYYVKTNLFGN